MTSPWPRRPLRAPLLWGLFCFAAPARAEELIHWGLDADDGGFVGGGDTLQWEWGTPSSGPAVTGTEGSTEQTWATVLDGNYLHNSLDWLRLPAGSLTNTTRPLLGLHHWTDIDPEGDAGWLEVWDGSAWLPLEPIYGYPSPSGFSGQSQGWITSWWDLSGVSDTSFLRFTFESNATLSRSGWYIDDVAIEDGDPVPPSVEVTLAPTDTEDLSGPYPVVVSIEDDVAVTDASILVSVDGAAEVRNALSPPPPGSNEWTGGILAVPPGSSVSWIAEASDGLNTTLSSTQSFRVFLPAPTDLSGPEGRVVGLTAPLRWSPPSSSHAVSAYRLYRDGEPILDVSEPEVAAPLEGPEDHFTVTALFNTGGDAPVEGDPSDTLDIDAAVPSVLSLSPDDAWQGDELRLTLQGEHLLLQQDAVSLDLGEGITLTSATVENVDLATFTLQIDEDASLGPRQGTLQSGAGEVPLSLDFTVLDGALRPMLRSISPEAVTQGDHLQIEILANSAIDATDATIELGEGLLVTDIWAEGERITVELVVENTAPLGLREVVLDDGVRLLGGVSLRVRDRAVASPTACGCASGPGHAPPPSTWIGLAGFALWVAVGRRKVSSN